MTTIALVAIVSGLLYAYSDQGWKLFYQSSSRGLSQLKAKLAIRTVSEELREANKSRITIGKGTTIGVPMPDDVYEGSSFIYFTKPIAFEKTGDITGYDYILYYFAKPKEKIDIRKFNNRKIKEREQYFLLKSIRFIKQSKFYTEDEEKTWPFLPPILEINKSLLPEDLSYIESLVQQTEQTQEETNKINELVTQKGESLFLDHFAKMKKESRNIPISGNFSASSLTDPFSNEEVNIFFGQEYKTDKPIKIKVSLDEQPVLLSLMAAMTEFEVKVTPRN